jgi:hemoglobin
VIGQAKELRQAPGAHPHGNDNSCTTLDALSFSTMTDETQQQTAYQLIGGEMKLRELVDRFYDLMDLEGEFAGIRALHPTTLEGSRDKLFWFLSGWMGGPDLFVERFGHPRLRARHLPYAIASSERDQWLRCIAWAMQDVGVPQTLQERLLESFYQTADWMRNKAG